jgi:tetratricopeptide (TPR) repeat protein
MAHVKTLILSILLLLLPAPAVAARQTASEARLTDAQTEALARSAMASSDTRFQSEVLQRLQIHHFKSSLAPERELVLGVQGLLEDRLGRAAQAAATFHKLEQGWPRSPFLGEGQVIMAESAAEHKRFQEAESRLHKALDADLPAESQRRGQELLLWCLAEEGRALEGIPIVKSLKPLGMGKPSERGLVGMMEALCAGKDKSAAEATLKDYHQMFPTGPRAARMDLDWAKLLGVTGDAQGAAQGFQSLIQSSPAAPEADEARLALATLLTDGRLPPKIADEYPSAQALLAALKKGALKEGPARQALLAKGRIALRQGRWQEAMDIAAQYRAQHPPPSERAQGDDLRAEAMRKWTQELLDRHEWTPLLPYLDEEGILCLTPDQRLGLTRRLALGGLPEATQAILRLAPPKERPALLKAALEGTASGANPRGALDLLPGKGETSEESLVRAQAELALHDWPQARAALAKATAGPQRIQGLLAYLDRPPETGETPAARLREVDAWLARAPEKGPDREPLAILAGDLRVRTGDWRGALARYPLNPQPANRGWVTLMRATCQSRLGQTAPARETLRQAGDAPDFKNERLALGQRLGM